MLRIRIQDVRHRIPVRSLLDHRFTVKQIKFPGISTIWGGNSLAGNQCQRWLGLFTVFGQDAVQGPGRAVRGRPSVGAGARAGTRPAPAGI